MTEKLQMGLLLGYVLLLACAVLAGWHTRQVRPLASAVGVLAASHVVYYVLFLLLPDVLDGQATMTFSIVLRYQVLFVAVLSLAIGIMRGRWQK